MQEKSSREHPSESLRPEVFLLWTPPRDRTVTRGAERREVVLPQLPFPLNRGALDQGDPSDDAIGQGIYDYLRQFPDCPYNVEYAELLRDVYPHYLADLGAQIVMLEHKEVDAPYVRRQIAYLKILALLDKHNSALRQRLGMSCFDLALMYDELPGCRRHLLESMGHFHRSVELGAGDATTFNYLGQIDFLFGDYPGALRRWQTVMATLEDGPTRAAFAAKIERIETGAVPDHPLIDDLEQVAEAMERYGTGHVEEVRLILEGLEEKGNVTAELPSAEFFYLLGLCRGKDGDAGGAFEAFEKALEIDPDFEPVLEARERILEGKGPLK